MKKIIVLIVISLIIFNCKDAVNGAKKGIKDGAIKASGEFAKESGVKLHVFSGGKIVVNKLQYFAQDSMTYKGQTKTFADAFYVIQHPKGNLMWDAGLPESLVGKEPFNDGAFTVSRKDSLVNQLETIGLKIEDFKYLAISHSHFDHVGHANRLANATWLVQKNEHEYITNDIAKEKNAEVYNMIKDLKKTKLLNGDFDVFGDGTVIIKYAPGHTIGHQTLYLNIGLEKPVILIGDLWHFEENRTHKRVPIFNHSKEVTLESMKNIETFAKEKGAEIILQHSPEDFEKLKKMINKNK